MNTVESSVEYLHSRLAKSLGGSRIRIPGPCKTGLMADGTSEYFTHIASFLGLPLQINQKLFDTSISTNITHNAVEIDQLHIG